MNFRCSKTNQNMPKTYRYWHERLSIGYQCFNKATFGAFFTERAYFVSVLWDWCHYVYVRKFKRYERVVVSSFFLTNDFFHKNLKFFRLTTKLSYLNIFGCVTEEGQKLLRHHLKDVRVNEIPYTEIARPTRSKGFTMIWNKPVVDLYWVINLS